MAFIDYYKTLGLDKSATQDDIKKAYRKLARKYHPDLNPNDKDANKLFQQINEANEALSDPEKRKKYDEYGEHWKNADQFEQAKQSQQQSRNAYSGAGQQGGGFTGADFNSDDFGTGGGFTGGGDYSDFFESLFGNASGQSRRGSRKFKGHDYQAEINISLRDAYNTHKQTLSVNGKNIRITIPAGIADGQIIKLPDQGALGANGGPNGDLYITFNISDDPHFKRLKDDLYTHTEIDLYTAVLGGDATITTLDSKVKLKVAPGTQNGTKVRLKGKGFPVYKKEGEFGNLFVTYTVKIPTELTEKQKELFNELKNIG
jgi:curved DNA-binding protein